MDNLWDQTLQDDVSSVPPADESLEALVESVKAAPYRFTKETNRNCARILNHCGLNPSKLPENLRCFDCYNGTAKCILRTFVTVYKTSTFFVPALTECIQCLVFQMGYVVILIKIQQDYGCSKGTLRCHTKV